MPGSYPPLDAYGFVSDCHSAALVSVDGSVDWCCFHRFDSRPVFARILDWERGGHYRIFPSSQAETTRRYLPGTNVLETRFAGATGVATLTDCMPVAPSIDLHGSEQTPPYHQLLRRIHCEEGTFEMSFEFLPRFDYGLTIPRFADRGGGIGVARGGADSLVFQSELPFDAHREGCRGRATLRAGEEVFQSVVYHEPHKTHAAPIPARELRRRLKSTVAFWRKWSDRCTYEGPHREMILRSALVLKGLTNAPTGAIVAAPTTSLPEQVGGVRNWDYRYTWIRDAAMNLYALFRLGYREEAHAFMHWLERTTAGRASDLQILYGVGGERMVPEVELTGLDGYRGSRPVRIGNAAVDQFQLDSYGEFIDTAWLYYRNGGEIEPHFWDFICQAVEVVKERWREPDYGLWEVRGGPQHFVSSKVMAWVAVDRAIRLGKRLGLEPPLERWRKLRREIRDAVESEGVDPEHGNFVQAFGSRALDAGNLLIPLVRFLPASDPRVKATIERIRNELRTDGLVSRYFAADGLPPGEGAFLICSFWLVDNLALAGEIDEAGELFEKLLGYANDLGLMSEEIDTATGDHLGNFPQAFSHIGLVGSAINLQAARARLVG